MTDFRAYLKPRATSYEAVERVIGVDDPSNVMQPLYDTGGLLFPYTPTIMQFGGNANYDEFHFTHTNYKLPVYKNSEVRDIAITAKFTAQTDYEGRYVLAMLKMMANVTKMTFGEQDSPDYYEPTGNAFIDAALSTGDAGLPPPVLLFNYLGSHIYKDVPVVVSSYGIDLPDNVDYIRVSTPNYDATDESTYVPTELTLTLEMKPYYNPKYVRQQFKLSDFASGDMIRGTNGRGGFL